MHTSIYRRKQRILSASEMSKTKNRELLVQRIFNVIQYGSHDYVYCAKYALNEPIVQFYADFERAL